MSDAVVAASERFANLELVSKNTHPDHLYHLVREVAYHLNEKMQSATTLLGHDLERLRELVGAARKTYSKSEFVKRIQTWPKGYPGDFETIDYVLQMKNEHETGTLSHLIQHFVLDVPMSQQHRNKVMAQTQEIRQCLDTQEKSRILSIACGASPDFAFIPRTAFRKNHLVVLNDIDDDALARSTSALSRLPTEQVNGNVFRKIRELAELGPYDLIVAGGLFDYLADKAAILLLKHCHKRLLKPGGRVFFTNIAEPNPYKCWLECIANWPLIERSEADLQHITKSAGFLESAIDIDADTSRLAHLVSVTK